PSKGLLGLLASKVMETANRTSIEDAVRRLKPSRNHDVWVELGAGHGFGIAEVLKDSEKRGLPKKVVACELSPHFRDILTEFQKTTGGAFEVFDKDALELGTHFQSESVDILIMMNVVYFLSPLPRYAEHFYQLIKPGGTVAIGCKFLGVKGAGPPFVNLDKDKIISSFVRAGFSVSTQSVDLGKVAYNYELLLASKR
ncbi:unnamed protein product, partial [Heterosigma akashiwo]